MSGGLVSFGFQHYTGSEFKSWQIMFLAVGLFTVAAGIVSFIFLPDSPMTSRLTPKEKYHAVERVRQNKTGIENKQWKWYQFWECLRDPQTWIFIVLIIANNTPNGSMSNFQAAVIRSFGFTDKQAALLNMGGGATNLVTCLIARFLPAATTKDSTASSC
jgi:MFS family permease